MSQSAEQPVRRPSRLQKLVELDAITRAKYPQLYWDRDLLVVEQVAAVMRCSVDTVRRIPRDELPYSRPGLRNLYLREDVVKYVRRRRIERTPIAVDVDALLADIEGGKVTRLPTSRQTKAQRKG